jgi:hypothetical protein
MHWHWRGYSGARARLSYRHCHSDRNPGGDVRLYLVGAGCDFCIRPQQIDRLANGRLAVHWRYTGGIRRRVGGQHLRWARASWLSGSPEPFVGIKFVTAANSRRERSCHVIPRHPFHCRSGHRISLVADRHGRTAGAGADPSFHAARGPCERRIEPDLPASGGDCRDRREYSLGVILAASLSGGSWFGAKVAHAVPRATLRGIVSSALVLIGLFILANVGWRLLG